MIELVKKQKTSYFNMVRFHHVLQMNKLEIKHLISSKALNTKFKTEKLHKTQNLLLFYINLY